MTFHAPVSLMRPHALRHAVARMMDGPSKSTTPGPPPRRAFDTRMWWLAPAWESVVKVDYTAGSDGGKMFDSSKGRSPIAFPVGKGRVIPGWDEGHRIHVGRHQAHHVDPSEPRLW